jgi:hypothetical protein
MDLTKDKMITAYRNHVQPGMGVDPTMCRTLGRVGTGTWVDHAHFLKGTPFLWWTLVEYKFL